jgi:hypothetical protein
MITHHGIPEQDLPDWIRSAKRGIDWGIIVTLMLSVAIGWSFIGHSGLPRTNALEHMVFRVENTVQSILEGRLYPRWNANTVVGYGAPVAHFYPPAPAYLPALLSVLFTDDSTASIRLTFLLCLAVAGAAVYGLVYRHFHAQAALIAALLYVYSPHVSFTVPHAQGDVAGMMTLALIPAYLWALDRVLGGGRADFLMLVLTGSALILADPLWAALPGGALGVVVLLAAALNGVLTPRRLALALAAGLLSGLLTSFYWLPALHDAGATRWHLWHAAPLQEISLSGLFSGFQAADPASLRLPTQWTLGLMLAAVAVPGCAALAGLRRWRSLGGMMALSGWLAATGTLAFHQPALLGTAALCFAITGGAVFAALWERWPQAGPVLLAVMGATVFTFSLPQWTSQRIHEAFGDTQPLAEIRYEQLGYGISVLPPGQWVPSNLAIRVAPNARLLSGYATQNVDRVMTSTTFSDQIVLLDDGTHRQTYQVRFPGDLTSQLLLNPFAGWRAYLGPRPLALVPDEVGYRINLPQSNITDLTIVFEDAYPRPLAWGIAWATLVITALITLGLRRSRTPYRPVYNALLTPRDLRLLVTGLVFSFALAVLGIAGRLPASLQPQAGHLLNSSASLGYRTDTPMQLLAYDLPQTSVQAGQTLWLRLYWQTTRPLDTHYRVSLSLVSASSGSSLLTTPPSAPGGYPTPRWAVNRYLVDTRHLLLPADLQPGRYTITVQAFPCAPRELTCDENRALTFFGADSLALGRRITLPQILTVGG